MGYDYPDLVWTPRVGSTGDERYHIPGATKLDGTVDSGAQTRAKASQVDDVIDEVNARNQEWYDAGLGGTSAQLAHLPTGKIKLADIGTVCTAIRSLRTYQGFGYNQTLPHSDGSVEASHTLPTSVAHDPWDFCGIAAPAVGDRMKGDLLASLRKGLSIYGRQCITDAFARYAYLRTDSPYGTKLSETVGADTSIGPLQSLIGRYKSGDNVLRRRIIVSVPVPPYFDTDIISCVKWCSEFYNYRHTTEDYSPAVYVMASDHAVPTLADFLNTAAQTQIMSTTSAQLLSYGENPWEWYAAPVSLNLLGQCVGSYLFVLYATLEELGGYGADLSASCTAFTEALYADHGA